MLHNQGVSRQVEVYPIELTQKNANRDSNIVPITHDWKSKNEGKG